ncbi:MAG: RDD family protein [Bacteroidales bacterium]|nr:RDD family protein [Bacteroidales bacterium]
MKETIGPIFSIYAAVVMMLFFALDIFLLVRRSQTIGKHLLNIQKVTKDMNARIGFWHYVIQRRHRIRLNLCNAWGSHMRCRNNKEHNFAIWRMPALAKSPNSSIEKNPGCKIPI